MAGTLSACYGCGRRTHGRYCAECTPPRKGYGAAAYRKLRALTLALHPAVCWICGEPISHDVTFDHLMPLALGGSPLGEGRPAHRSCNSRRGATQPTRRLKLNPGGRKNL